MGEWANGRMGDEKGVFLSNSALYFCGGFDYPLFGLINHFNNLRHNFITRVVKGFEGLLIDVAMPGRDFDVDLGFTCLRLCITKALAPW
jgi:hypothetical protein